jgi:hypothetical protein
VAAEFFDAAKQTDGYDKANSRVLQFFEHIYNSFLVLGFLYCVQGKFPDDISGPTAAPETSSGIHLSHRAKTIKPKINIHSTVKV